MKSLRTTWFVDRLPGLNVRCAVVIIEYVRYRIELSDAERFEAAYRAASASLEASSECLHYELARCHEEPERYVLRIHWTSVGGHLEGFRKSPEFRSFLNAVRPYIDRIEEMQHYEATEVKSPLSIYEAVGGASTFFRIAKRMHDEMKADETIGSMFSSTAETHVPHLGMWLCEVFGGPTLYSDILGDIGPMLLRHAKRNLTEAQRAAFVSCARRAVEETLGSDHPLERDAIVSYLEWGSHIAVENSKPDHVLDRTAGVPKWSRA